MLFGFMYFIDETYLHYITAFIYKALHNVSFYIKTFDSYIFLKLQCYECDVIIWLMIGSIYFTETTKKPFSFLLASLLAAGVIITITLTILICYIMRRPLLQYRLLHRFRTLEDDRTFVPYKYCSKIF